MGKNKSDAPRSSATGGSWVSTKQRKRCVSWTLWTLGPLLAAAAIAFVGAPNAEAEAAALKRRKAARSPMASDAFDSPDVGSASDAADIGGDPTKPPPMDTWEKPSDCLEWAGAGQCKDNPGFMLERCAFSCAKIEYAKARYFKRCPKPPGYTPALAPGAMNATFERVMSDFQHLEPELLSSDPPVILFHNFFKPSETEAFIRHGKGRYSKSLGVGIKEDGTVGDVKTEIRTSSHGWCQHAECLNDPEVRRVIQRVSDVTQTPEANAEYAQLVYYHSCPSADDPSCAFYKRHNDYIDSDEHKLQGPRIYTLFGYMNDVPEGGGTRFTSLPAAKYRDANGMVTIQPQRGKAILWPSVTEAEPFKKEERTDHEALPVTRGEKFGANFWVHQYDFKGAHATGCTHDK